MCQPTISCAVIGISSTALEYSQGGPALPMNGNETLTIPAAQRSPSAGGVRAPWLLARAAIASPSLAGIECGQ